MLVNPESRHLVVLRRGQFCSFLLTHNRVACLIFCLDWFDVLDDENKPVLTEREVIRNLQAITTDADKTERSEVRSRFPCDVMAS